MKPVDEADAIRARYARRDAAEAAGARHDAGDPAVACMWQERRQAVRTLLVESGWSHATWPTRRVLEIGCGAGGNLADLIEWGATPERLVGIDLVPQRVDLARRRLPPQVRLHDGDALERLADPAAALGNFDLVMLFTVLSSVLDGTVRRRLVEAAWQAVAPAGLLLVYDFVFDNPRNPDVRAVAVPDVVAACAGAAVTVRRLTLAPPLARAACAVHPSLYAWLNRIAGLRTHRLVALARPASADTLST
jgi:SAM-dependent methyltransferase